MSNLASLLFKAMLAIAPIEPTVAITHEDPAALELRYRNISEAIANVVFDEEPIYADDADRRKTAAIVLATAYYESGHFRRDVDLGTKRGDGGGSYCLMQVFLWNRRVVLDSPWFRFAETPIEGWSGTDLVKDREKCFRTGLHFLRMSKQVCKNYPHRSQFSAYISGNCRTSAWNSAMRVALAHQVIHIMDDLEAESFVPECREDPRGLCMNEAVN